MADHDSIFCPNCRQKTNLKIRQDYNRPNPAISRDYNKYSSHIWYEIGECNGCDFFFLVKRRGSYINKIYPDPLPKPIPEKTPDFLQDDLKEAYLCLAAGAYRAAGVMARRALQLCCIKKGAPGKNLHEQIDWLLNEQIITKDLKESAHEVRLTGNDAAHPPKNNSKDESVSKEDAEDILELLESFIEVLYIMPALTEERRQKRNTQDSQ